jgi:[acyl-carrier-protein] S-malonyltransferase/trans-AT polyketide synthase/acyltransferase/oxidoreductase domain-containing protein
MAMFHVLEAECGLQPTHFGGHSLGEYTALTAAGVLGLSEAVRLVRERGRRMQAAVPLGLGNMMALTGRDLDLAAIESCLDGLAVDVASVNSPHQLVLSGLAEAIGVAAIRIAASIGGRGVKQSLLVVSAPFHSRLLAAIEPDFRRLLKAAARAWQISRAQLVTANFTGRFHVANRAAVVDALTRQISGRVRWTENALALKAVAPERLIEIGPTGVLRGLLLHAGIRARSVTCFADRHILGEANVG